MLGNKKPIATLGVSDLERAKQFYEGQLGLKAAPDSEPTTAVYLAGDSTFFVYESQFAGTNEATAVTWDIGDEIEELVQSLAAKGVLFEHYADLPHTTIQGDLHLAGNMKLAWFKDPDGNIHALMGR